MVQHLSSFNLKEYVRPGQEKVWDSRFAKAKGAMDKCSAFGLRPTPYFVEAFHYWKRAKALQERNLGTRPKSYKSECQLQNAIPIYDTVERRYAGFSNVLEQLWYGDQAPKYQANKARGFDYPRFKVAMTDTGIMEWMYICLVHRLTGSGASFEHDHGWRNTIVPAMAEEGDITYMAKFAGAHAGPAFTSIGNQIPPFSKKTEAQYRNAGHEYLANDAVDLVRLTYDDLSSDALRDGKPAGIKVAVDAILENQRMLGHKQFKFVFTAWAMDIAEYLPNLVDPWSDCYHGKNAQESLDVCLQPVERMTKQQFYDRGTRLFSEITGTKPMDVEDASPGCDLIRWLENYVPRKGFDHVRQGEIFNCSTLFYQKGRQPGA